MYGTREFRDKDLGIWLKHKQTGEVCVIVDVFRTNDGWSECGTYTLKTLDNKKIAVGYDKYDRLLDKYELCQSAQILYGNKI